MPDRPATRPAALLVALAVVWAVAAAAEGPPKLKRPRRGVQITVGPVAVERNTEVTSCTYLKLPSKRDLDVNQVEIKVAGGSHHIHLYRPQDPALNVVDGQEACNFALDFSIWQLILASQNVFLKWRLPPGVCFHFRAGEQLAAQTHYVDTGLLTTEAGQGWAVFNLHSMPRKKVKAYAGAMFGQDRDVVVTPGTSTATTRCLFPKPVTLLAVTGHYHFRGTRFTAGSWDGQTGSDFYVQDGYYDPAFLTFSEKDAPTVQGIQWTCTYENPTDQTFTFGPFTDENEHCNLFAFYYPAAGKRETLTCVQQNGVPTTTVRGEP